MNKLINRLKEIKHKEIILAIAAVVIMLFIYFSSFFSPQSDTKSVNYSEDYCAAMQNKIKEAVSKMEGVGKTEVVINWSSGVEIVTAQNTTVNGNSTSSQVVQSSGGPIVLKEIYPRAIGVLIICEGGNNAKIKVDIIMAISTLMDITAEKVLVFGMSN